MSLEKCILIAKTIAASDPRVTSVHLFGSQAKGEKPDSDIDMAVLVKSDQQPGVYNVRGPLGQKIRETLKEAGYQVGKGPGCVDFDLARDEILNLSPKDQGILGRAFLSGRRLYP